MANLHSGYHYPAAGIDARLSRIEQLLVDLSPKDQATLNNAGIRPIIRMMGRTIPFGAELPATDTMYTFLHVRRIQSNYVRLLLESMPLIRALFKPNQPDLADRIQMILDTYFRSEYGNGVLNNYRPYEQAIRITVQGPLSTNSVSGENANDELVALANGDLQVFISYLPTGILKNLYINLGPDLITASFAS
jgi:phage tail sheath protein FI